MKGQSIRIPPGRYKITDFLTIRDRGTVLQGAGPDKSVLVFPKPLNAIKPDWGETTSRRPTSNYSWSGGFIQVLGSFPRDALARVSAPADRGDRSLSVSTCEPFHIGDIITLRLTDTPDKSLTRALYADDPGPINKLRRVTESFACRITRVNPAAGRIEFDRPLRTEVRLEWQPALFADRSTVEEVGIENLGFEFPNTPYEGHFTELGFNAIAISGARNCWIRIVHIHNCDSGIFIHGENVTVTGVLITSDRAIEPSRRATGHHGITLGGQDNLLRDFDYQTRFMHGITVTRGSAGNVAMNGRGLDLALDHHKYGPHANLFTDIDLGEGSRMFQSGGGADLGRHSAAYETFWNIRARQPQSWPASWGPDLMNLIGVQNDGHSVTNRNGRWFEAISPEALEPANLYESQRSRRLNQHSANR